jgi:hypothetical protein
VSHPKKTRDYVTRDEVREARAKLGASSASYACGTPVRAPHSLACEGCQRADAEAARTPVGPGIPASALASRRCRECGVDLCDGAALCVPCDEKNKSCPHLDPFGVTRESRGSCVLKKGHEGEHIWRRDVGAAQAIMDLIAALPEQARVRMDALAAIAVAIDAAEEMLGLLGPCPGCPDCEPLRFAELN